EARFGSVDVPTSASPSKPMFMYAPAPRTTWPWTGCCCPAGAAAALSIRAWRERIRLASESSRSRARARRLESARARAALELSGFWAVATVATKSRVTAASSFFIPPPSVYRERVNAGIRRGREVLGRGPYLAGHRGGIRREPERSEWAVA